MADYYLTTHPVDYGSFLKSYEKHASEYNSTWLLDSASEVLNSLLPKTQGDFASLSIGCSYGIRDMKILEKVCSTLSSTTPVIYRAIDPDAPGLAEFSIDATNRFGDRVKLEALSTTWQKYVDENISDQKFDFITSFQSIYFMEPESTLVECYKELKSGGVFMCVASGDTPSGQKQNYWANPVGFYDGELSLPAGSFTVVTSTLLTGIAKKHGWKYEVTDHPSFIDASVFFKGTSAEADALLDILLHIKDSKHHLTPEKRETLLGKIRKNCVDKDGKKMIENTHCVFLVHKN